MLCHKRGTKKNFWVPMRNRTSDLQIPHSDALLLSHRDSSVSKVYYEVRMTRVLHTARISNVDSVMFLGLRIFFFCPILVTRRKTSFFISLPSSKFTISLISIYNFKFICRCPFLGWDFLNGLNWYLSHSFMPLHFLKQQKMKRVITKFQSTDYMLY